MTIRELRCEALGDYCGNILVVQISGVEPGGELFELLGKIGGPMGNTLEPYGRLLRTFGEPFGPVGNLWGTFG